MQTKDMLTRLAKGEPINTEDRMAELEKNVDIRLKQFEDSLIVFKDLMIKMYEERENLREENSRLKQLVDGIKTGAEEVVVKPIMETGRDFAEIVIDRNGGEQENSEELPSLPKPSYDKEKAKTVQWMRQKFGLPPQGGRRGRKPKAF